MITTAKKIDTLGDPLAEIESYIDFAVLAAEVDRIAPRPVSPQGGRPPYPTETMVRILVLKRLYNLSDEQMEYPLVDRMTYKRFCGLQSATNIPDRTTAWDKLPRASAIVAAVAHTEYADLGVGQLCEKLVPNGVFSDVRSCYDPAAMEAAGAKVWRL